MSIPINYIQKDFFEDTGKRSYDFVLSLGVIEHFEEEKRKQFLNTCINMSNKYIFIAIPNQNSTVFKSYVSWSNRNNNNYEEEHQKFDTDDLLGLINEMGLDIVKVGGFQMYLSESDFLKDAINDNQKYIEVAKEALVKQNKTIGNKFPKYNFKEYDIDNMIKAELSCREADKLEMAFMTYVLCKKSNSIKKI